MIQRGQVMASVDVVDLDPMYLLDDDGQIIDAECSFDQFEGSPCVVVESSGGANVARGVKRRNPDYNRLLSILFTRLADNGVQINSVVLDSHLVSQLPVEERVARLRVEYPVSLTTIDIEEFRKMLQREISLMHRDPAAMKGGNAQKKIRIFMSKRVDSRRVVSKKGETGAADQEETHAPGLTETERNYLKAARLGQGQFRSDLIKKFIGVCPVTGINDSRLIIASHIKPWNVSTNAERLDVHNGILFSALADRLFDQGLVSFSDVGEVMVSPSLSTADRDNCGIESWAQLRLSDQGRRYMEYHRAIEFISA